MKYIDCKKCQGFGYFNYPDKPTSQFPNGHKEVCYDCKGSGKVKT